ncbi:hypothetical protein JNE17039_46850 (plasmid) [Escherichia coli]
MKQIAYIVIALMGVTLPTIGSAGTTELRKYTGDKQNCEAQPIKEKVERWGMCTQGIFDRQCPSGRCSHYLKPNKYGQCPSGYNLTYCSNGLESACGKYTETQSKAGHYKTVCTTVKGGYLKSEISFPDEIELREGEHTEINVKGDCTAITIGSKGGRIIPQETRVCGTGKVKITKQPGAEGVDYVVIKAQIVQ